MCNTCTSMCIKLSLKKQHVNKIHFGVFGFMSCFVQIYMTNTADTKKLSGRVRDVLRQSWASHSLNSASKQTNISTYHQFNNAQNYQWTDFVHYCDFIYSQSRRIQARVIYNLSIRLSSKPFNWPVPTVAGTDTWVPSHAWLPHDSTRDQKNIFNPNIREKKKIKGKVPLICRGEQWIKRGRQEPAWALPALLMSPDSGTWLRTNG